MPQKPPKRIKMPIKELTSLTIKQRKFVSAKIAGKKNAIAYKDAGYSVSTRAVAEVNASRLLKKANIRQAIDNALEYHGATPEFAVGVLKQVADSDEVGARRLAAKDILELHGWQRGDRPSITLDMRGSSFFNNPRLAENQSQEQGL